MILRDHPGALHVRLDGPPERRVAKAMARTLTARELDRALLARQGLLALRDRPIPGPAARLAEFCA